MQSRRPGEVEVIETIECLMRSTRVKRLYGRKKGLWSRGIEGHGMFRGERLVRRIGHGVSARGSTADTGAWFTAPRRRRYRDSKAAHAQWGANRVVIVCKVRERGVLFSRCAFGLVLHCRAFSAFHGTARSL